MRPTVDQVKWIRDTLRECRALRDDIDSDGQNDLGAALTDAGRGLEDALGMIEGGRHGQVLGSHSLGKIKRQ